MLLAVLGAGGHGRVVAESAAALGWSLVFFDDVRSGMVDGWSVAGSAKTLLDEAGRFDGVFVAIGDNRKRLEWHRALEGLGASMPAICDPSSQLSSSAVLGSGSYLARSSIVGTGAVVGKACIVNTAATVDHDCVLLDAVHLSPGVHLSGGVEVGEASWIGTSGAVRNNIRIGSNVVVGVGGVVVSDIVSGSTVVGVPARPLERH